MKSNEKNWRPPLAKLLEAARRNLSITQAALAAHSGVTDRTISAIETKEIRAIPKAETLIRLALATGQEPAEWLAIVGLECSREDVERVNAEMDASLPAGLLEEKLINQAQDYVRRVGAGNLDIWLLGPDLPVAESPRIRDVWITNLIQGASYRVLWLLDVLSPPAMRNLASVLSAIGWEVTTKRSEADRQRGQILHYASSFYSYRDGSDAQLVLAEPLELYERLTSVGIPCNNFHEPCFSLSAGTRLSLAKYTSCFASVILYSPRTITHRPLATLALRNSVTRSTEGKELSVFYWFTQEHAHMISSIMKRFEKEYSGKKSSRRAQPTSPGD